MFPRSLAGLGERVMKLQNGAKSSHRVGSNSSPQNWAGTLRVRLVSCGLF